jgi:DNA-directed RNA polymerase specialized sigma24 family protein/CheY-like chemotaxis protein
MGESATKEQLFRSRDIFSKVCSKDQRELNMKIHEAIANQLPYLRRYARTLTGSQSVGDAAVRETLEAIIAAPDEFRGDTAPRVELYRVFHKIWSDSSLTPIDLPGAVVGSLPRRSRKALLLTTIEGFSEQDAAHILGMDQSVLHDDIAGARGSINQMLAAKVMIIEDEPIIALHLKNLMASMGHTVVGTYRTKSEAVDMAPQLQPELILADVNLADGSSGIDAVADILEYQSVPVVFITAFPERLLTGERLEPAYLISKPFEPENVAATVWQALLVHREKAALAAADS